MLRKVRIVLATIFFIDVTLLFLDFTGVLHLYLGWMAKIQFIPAVLALNFGIVAGLLLLTLLFGRVYCSVICPLGVMQDIISWIHGKAKKKNLYRFKYRRPLTALRYTVLVAFIAAMALGVTSIAALIAPYSAYGRIATELFAPVYRGCNNLLSMIAEHFDSYAFYSTDVWIKSVPTFIAAVVTFVLLATLSWKWGRIWCNSVCPVGSLLGLVSSFSLFAPIIDKGKCRNCGLCGRRCKSSCIDTSNHRIDYSRCVACMDCISTCRDGAIKYRFRYGKKPVPAEADGNGVGSEAANTTGTRVTAGSPANGTRREFIKATAVAVGAAVATEALRPVEAAAQQMKVDGGLITLPQKKVPHRETPLKPAGSGSLKQFTDHCIACQLCVSACPNRVLRPSTALETLMQPEMSYEKGYCRPECTRCSQVCPAGAIAGVTREEKASIQIGHAVVDYGSCIANVEDKKCGNCARHCPVGAIRLVKKNPDDPDSVRIPSVNEERCIGCGACEYNCPVSPTSAIHVEGHEVHKEL
mgnify:CR=1 FL=1